MRARRAILFGLLWVMGWWSRRSVAKLDDSPPNLVIKHLAYGRARDAVVVAREILSRDPGHHSVRLNLATALYLLRQNDQARQEMSRLSAAALSEGERRLLADLVKKTAVSS